MKTHISNKNIVILSIMILSILSITTINTNVQADDNEWKIYNNELYNIIIPYPSNWFVIPMKNYVDSYGSITVFQSKHDNKQIVFGVYLSPKDYNISLEEWMRNYTEKTTPFKQIEVELKPSPQSIIIHGNEAYISVLGKSPKSNFVFTNIEYYNLVWFLWSDNIESENLINYMSDSIQFGANTPRSLSELLAKSIASNMSTTTDYSSYADIINDYSILGSDPPGYRLPFTGWFIITNGPGCSSLHQNRSFEAIDYALPTNTRVKSTYDGTVIVAGWDNTGFGNLMKVSQNGGIRTSWYAHLSSFISCVGCWVGKGQSIAYSGNTGNSTGPHLHFEVRNSSNQSIWIRTLPTTVWYTGDPNNPCSPPGSNDGEATGP